MIKADYHIHNHFSPDSSEDTRKIARQALKKGFKEICITNHIELYDEKTGRDVFRKKEAKARFKAIQAEIDEIQAEFPTVRIGVGVELEYLEGQMDQMSSFVEEAQLDFVLGSVHIVDDVIISSHKYADRLYSKTDEKTAYQAYFRELKKLVEWGHFDAVAHFDICKKYGYKFYGPFRPEHYKPQIMPILKTMAEKGIGLELNTKCLKDKCRELFPHPDILRWAIKAGVRHFTLGSDAHESKDLGLNYEETIKIAKDAGLPAISSYIKRNPTLHPL